MMKGVKYTELQVGKAEFLGRATAKPHVYLEEDVSNIKIVGICKLDILV